MFKGGGDALQALLSGTCQLSSGSLPPAAQHIKAGTLRCLAVTGETRWPDMPDVPTMLESGYKDFVFATDTVLLAPAKTPPEAIKWIETETLKVLGTAEMKEKLYKAGFQVRAKGAKDAWTRVTKEIDMFKNIIDQAGIAEALVSASDHRARRCASDGGRLPTTTEVAGVQIKTIEPIAVSLPMRKPVIMAGEEVRRADNVLVRIESDNGVVGWGEAASAPVMTGDTLESIVSAVHYLSSALRGRDPADIAGALAAMDGRMYGNHGAKAAIEIALHDLAGRAAAKPVHALLGEKKRSRIPLLGVIGGGDLEGDLRDAASKKSAGVTAYKIKVGIDTPEERRRTNARDLQGARRRHAHLGRRQPGLQRRAGSHLCARREWVGSRFLRAACCGGPACGHGKSCGCNRYRHRRRRRHSFARRHPPSPRQQGCTRRQSQGDQAWRHRVP